MPDTFRFSVKRPRTITHDAKLVDVAGLLDAFHSQASNLGDRLGCVLVQLPPKLDFDPGVAAAFFAVLRSRFDCMVACGARHPGWFCDEAAAVLTNAGVTRVIADPAKGQPGAHVPTTAAIYMRLHGSPRTYYSSYEPAYLVRLSTDIATHQQAGRPVWCIYDRAGTARLIALFRSHPFVRKILFNDPEIHGVAPWDKHDDHFHVDLWESKK